MIDIPHPDSLHLSSAPGWLQLAFSLSMIPLIAHGCST